MSILELDLELKALGNYYGTEHYYSVMGVNVTDGVRYVMENGYSWLVTDILPLLRLRDNLKREPFLVIQLTPHNSEADLTITDGGKDDNAPVLLYSHRYKFTDARRELKLFYADSVLMLSSEY